MKNDKLVFRKQRKRSNDNLYRIRVSGEAYEIVEKINEKTNVSLNDVATRMILFAYEHIEIQNQEDDEKWP